jgi:hypothetical protein
MVVMKDIIIKGETIVKLFVRIIASIGLFILLLFNAFLIWGATTSFFTDSSGTFIWGIDASFFLVMTYLLMTSKKLSEAMK